MYKCDLSESMTDLGPLGMAEGFACVSDGMSPSCELNQVLSPSKDCKILLKYLT